MNRMNRTRKILSGIAIIIVLSAVYVVWDNYRMVTTQYTFKSDRIDKSLKIVQISDFHMCEKHGDRMVQKVEAESPQFIAITGDFLDGSRSDITYSLQIAKRLTEIAPVYYVTGNHEIYELGSEYRDELNKCGVTILSGEKTAITDTIDLVGIEDPLLYWRSDLSSTDIIQDELRKINLNNDHFNILLSHRPEAFSAYVQAGYDLVLTGHTHGGQIRIPFIGGLVAPDQGLLPKYDAGIYEEDGTAMIVSRGIGTSILPIRINDPAELVTIELMKD